VFVGREVDDAVAVSLVFRDDEVMNGMGVAH